MKKSLVVACVLGAGILGPRHAVADDCEKPQAPIAVTDVSPKRCELGQPITVTVRGLPELVAKANDPVRKPQKIIVYLDGMPLKGLVPDQPSDPEEGQLHFRLVRSPESSEAWTHILGKPDRWVRPVKVSVGLDGEWAVPYEAESDLELSVVPQGWAMFFFVILCMVGVCFLVLASISDLLREPVPPPDNTSPKQPAPPAPLAPPAAASPPVESGPLSLARTQMAWWFFLILTAYLFIGLVTNDFTTGITGSALVLLGISGATFVGSTMIDVAQRGAAKPPKRQTWWLDLVSDANGVSFHRFQIVAWTVVLGTVFAINVYKYLAMPQFDEYLLALMGISAGTYLGYKLPNPNPTETPPPENHKGPPAGMAQGAGI